ncbi:MAG: DsbA family oxidoreductase [Arachnia sp.]
MRIDIWSDVVCPFCYLGKQRLDAALRQWQHADAVEIVWHSFELDPHASRESSESLAEHIATKYGTSLAQSEASQEALAEQFAAEGGLRFNWRTAKPGNTFDAHRVFHYAVEQGVGEVVMGALMRAYFSEGAPVADRASVARVAAEAGLDAEAVAHVLDSEAYAAAVRDDEAQAREIGISGVPFFVFDGRLAVSGAQPTEVFLQALTQAWETRKPQLMSVGGADQAPSCGPDGCETPTTSAG